MLGIDEEVTSGYQCFHCLTNGVIWQADFDFDDYALEGQGIVHVCHCANCGAEIEYRIRIDDEENEDFEDDDRELPWTTVDEVKNVREENE